MQTVVNNFMPIDASLRIQPQNFKFAGKIEVVLKRVLTSADTRNPDSPESGVQRGRKCQQIILKVDMDQEITRTNNHAVELKVLSLVLCSWFGRTNVSQDFLRTTGGMPFAYYALGSLNHSLYKEGVLP